MKLYFHPVSTASRPVVMFMADENISYEPVVVDLMTGAQFKEPFIGLNPSAMVPFLDDEGFILTESAAILRYLAEKVGSKIGVLRGKPNFSKADRGAPDRVKRV